MLRYRLIIISSVTFLLLAACGDGDGEGGQACGNSQREGDEVCDGADLASMSCQGLGFSGGTLACKATCLGYDKSGCTAPKTCGNGKKDGLEACDGTDLAGKTCEALGLGAGTLKCLPNCADFDTSGFGAPKTCGNGKKDKGEVCDGADLGGATCKGLGFAGGALKCLPNCLGYDKAGCTSNCVPDCSARKCGPDPKCGKSCGTCPKNHACDPSTWTCQKTCDLDPFTKDTTVALNAATLTIKGEIKLNGKTMGDDPGGRNRAYLRFANRLLGDSTSVTLNKAGPATFNKLLWAGAYDLTLEDDSYQKVLPTIRTKLRTGCLTNTGPCTKSDKDLSGNWRLIPSAAYWLPVSVDLQQSGSTLTGTATTNYGPSPISGGVRTGNLLSFSFKSSICMLQTTATVLSGCLMDGSFLATQCASTIPYSPFVGVRLK